MEQQEAKKIIQDDEATTEQKKQAVLLAPENDKPESKIDAAVRQHEVNSVKESEKKEETSDNQFDYDFDDEEEYRVTKKEALAQIKLLFSRYRIKLKKIRKRDPDQASAIEVSTDVILDSIRLRESEIYLDKGEVRVKQYIGVKSDENTIPHIIYKQAKGEYTSSLPTGDDVSGTERVDILLGMMNEDVAGMSTIKQLSPYDLKTARSYGIIFLV